MASAANLTGPLITEAAREGDQTARELLGEIGHWLGVGIANLAAAFDPGTFVIGGGVSAAGDLLLDPARATFRRQLTGRGYRPGGPHRRRRAGQRRRADRRGRPGPRRRERRAGRLSVDGALRVASYNLRDLKDDVDAAVRVVRAIEPDVLCLQEVPRHPFSGHRVADLARRCGLMWAGGHRGSGGTTILTALRVDVGDARHERLPVPRMQRERGYAVATVALPGRDLLEVVSVHLSLDADERARHAGDVLRTLPSDRPLVAGGRPQRGGGRPGLGRGRRAAAAGQRDGTHLHGTPPPPPARRDLRQQLAGGAAAPAGRSRPCRPGGGVGPPAGLGRPRRPVAGPAPGEG